jgi:prepilin-type N-terminal cleavage/methylation domain-containing protein
MRSTHARDRGAHARDDGFTLIELMTALLLIAVLLSIAIPIYADVAGRSRETTCSANRRTTELADYAYFLQHASRPASVATLVGGYLTSVPVCPSKGTLVFMPASADVPCRTMVCSIHYTPLASSPIGAGFTSITTNMSDLIAKYRARTHDWPSDSPPRNFTDLGLTPADWAKAYDHAYYTPAGSRVNVAPETGYSLVVKTKSGSTKTVTSGSKTTLVKDVSTGKWYYGSVSKSNEVDIATLQAVKK